MKYLTQSLLQKRIQKDQLHSMKPSPSLLKSAYSIVQPVHHRVKINKAALSPRFPGLKFPKNDIRSPAFKPVSTHLDRLEAHYYNTLQSDLLLMNYSHNQDIIKGAKRRRWDGSSPYHINRPLRSPLNSVTEQPDIHPVDWSRIPQLDNVVLNCFVNKGMENEHYQVLAALQLQQITNMKPKVIYSKKDVPSWKLRRGRKMGAKVVLKGKPMYEFMSTLTELVLPCIRNFKGLPSKSGNRFGALSFGLSADDVKLFPEIKDNIDMWPQTFGFHVNINTNAENDDRAKSLLSAFQFPIQ